LPRARATQTSTRYKCHNSFQVSGDTYPAEQSCVHCRKWRLLLVIRLDTYAIVYYLRFSSSMPRLETGCSTLDRMQSFDILRRKMKRGTDTGLFSRLGTMNIDPRSLGSRMGSGVRYTWRYPRWPQITLTNSDTSTRGILKRLRTASGHG
jgi:hypothetical protein